MKAFALGLGLNDDALTFSRAAFAAAFGDAGVAVEPEDAKIDVVADAVMVGWRGAPEALLAVGCDVWRVLVPRNGGMLWMTMLIPGLPVAATRGGGAAAAGAAGFAAAPFAGGAAAVLALAVGALGFRPGSGEILAASAGPPRGAPGAVDGEEEAPMFRAWAEVASFVDFSLIARCFSSSLARIGTRSSGMGLFS